MLIQNYPWFPPLPGISTVKTEHQNPVIWTCIRNPEIANRLFTLGYSIYWLCTLSSWHGSHTVEVSLDSCPG